MDQNYCFQDGDLTVSERPYMKCATMKERTNSQDSTVMFPVSTGGLCVWLSSVQLGGECKMTIIWCLFSHVKPQV